MHIGKLTIVIDGFENEAFSDGNMERETVRILEVIADKISMRGIYDHPIFDANGNKVGRVKVSHE